MDMRYEVREYLRGVPEAAQSWFEVDGVPYDAVDALNTHLEDTDRNGGFSDGYPKGDTYEVRISIATGDEGADDEWEIVEILRFDVDTDFDPSYAIHPTTPGEES